MDSLKEQRQKLYGNKKNYGYELFSIIMHEGTASNTIFPPPFCLLGWSNLFLLQLYPLRAVVLTLFLHSLLFLLLPNTDAKYWRKILMRNTDVVSFSGNLISGSGHYYSYIFDEKQNQWLKFNDKYVTKVEEKDLLEEAFGNGKSSKNACSLFYRNIKNKMQIDQPVQFNARLIQEIQVID